MDYPLTIAQYQQALNEGKLVGLYCESCGTYTIPPLGVCRSCGGLKLTQTEMEGRGIIRTFTVIRVAPEGIQAPYILAMVELTQGSWMIGRIIGLEADQADMSLIGQKVFLRVQPLKDPGSTADQVILTFVLG
ncbi:MAG: nucleic acid-binding protein [Desulfobacca sp.]|nr:nucleic acid-binding protein [Desulfobacca sp.]